MVSSDHVLSFEGLLTIKDDGEREDELLQLPSNQAVSEDDVLHALNIPPESLLIPEASSQIIVSEF